MSFKRRCWIVTGTVMFLAMGGLFFAGCEIDSASSTVQITPDSAVLAKGQSVTLTAEGGYEYTWSLATETWGTLNTRRGNQVVYTSMYEPSGTPVVQTVTVVSRFTTTMSGWDGSSSGAILAITNTSSTNVQSAQAYITHLPSAVTSSVSM